MNEEQQSGGVQVLPSVGQWVSTGVKLAETLNQRRPYRPDPSYVRFRRKPTMKPTEADHRHHAPYQSSSQPTQSR